MVDAVEVELPSEVDEIVAGELLAKGHKPFVSDKPEGSSERWIEFTNWLLEEFYD